MRSRRMSMEQLKRLSETVREVLARDEDPHQEQAWESFNLILDHIDALHEELNDCRKLSGGTES